MSQYYSVYFNIDFRVVSIIFAVFVILVRVSVVGALFGAVGSSEFSEAFTNINVAIDKSEVQLPDGPIKETGDHNIVISVHPEVSVEVLVKVSPE